MTTAPNKPSPAAMDAACNHLSRSLRKSGNTVNATEAEDLARALDAFAAQAREEQLDRLRIMCGLIPNEGLRATVLDAMGLFL